MLKRNLRSPGFDGCNLLGMLNILVSKLKISVAANRRTFVSTIYGFHPAGSWAWNLEWPISSLKEPICPSRILCTFMKPGENYPFKRAAKIRRTLTEFWSVYVLSTLSCGRFRFVFFGVKELLSIMASKLGMPLATDVMLLHSGATSCLWVCLDD